MFVSACVRVLVQGCWGMAGAVDHEDEHLAKTMGEDFLMHMADDDVWDNSLKLEDRIYSRSCVFVRVCSVVCTVFLRCLRVRRGEGADRPTK